MYAGSHEWQRPEPAAFSPLAARPKPNGYAEMYRRLMRGTPDASMRAEAAELLDLSLLNVNEVEDDLPHHPDGLLDWMQSNTQAVHAKYAMYLASRKAGEPRRFFTNRAHALYVLRNLAPTKLVDGAWLYGLMRHAANPKLFDLVRTYVEELGEGDAGKNHVVLYRKLLHRYNLDPIDDLDDEFYLQGLIQLALGWNAEEFLPEIIGFNLGYEQLPLHLLITAHELNELGLDPYYFTLHLTVDNGDTGHGRRACQAVQDMLPQLADGGEFWRRVRLGSKLSRAGAGTMDVIRSFCIGDEVARVLARKSVMGHGAHSNYCRVAGKTVNEWLAEPEGIPAFLAALESEGWIKRGSPVEESRFWGLLQGPRAEMFGVFSSYELQVIYDWIRDSASSDGAAHTEGSAPASHTRRASFRAMQRARPLARGVLQSPVDLLDPDLDELNSRLAQLQGRGCMDVLVELMSPSMHWTPAGLAATQAFWALR